MSKDNHRLAAEAYADLNALHGIVGFLESRMLSSRRGSAERRIIKICMDESQKCLRDFDHFTFLAKTER